MIPPSEEIIRHEIMTNENNSHVVNSDLLFQLFSTELFDPSSKSIKEMQIYLDVVADQDTDNAKHGKGATLLK